MRTCCGAWREKKTYGYEIVSSTAFVLLPQQIVRQPIVPMSAPHIVEADARNDQDRAYGDPETEPAAADANRRMFDRIAGRYDVLNACLSFGLDRWWRRCAVTALAPVAGGLYLDLGCGTGDVAIAIARRAPAARVIGLDPAERMLALGRAKLCRRGLAQRVELRAGDALALPFETGVFAGAISAFCFRNIASRARALAEVRRVLRPGGRLVVLELTPPAARWWRWGHRLYQRRWVPWLGGLLSQGDAYRYLTTSIEAFQAAAFMALWAPAGFAPPRATPLTGGVVTLFTGDLS